MCLENKVVENSGGIYGGYVVEGNFVGGIGGDGSFGFGDFFGGVGGGGGGISSEGIISSVESSVRGYGLKSGGRSGSFGGSFGGDVVVVGNNIVVFNNFDVLLGVRFVVILVFGSFFVVIYVVDDFEVLVVFVRGFVREVGKIISLFDSVLGSIFMIGNLGIEFDLYGGLRIISVVFNVGVFECVDDLVVNDLVELF